MQKRISVEEAQTLLLSKAWINMQDEYVCLHNSLERVLSQDIQAEEKLPPFDRSAVDGYAICISDTLKAREDHPVSLHVLEEVPAGFVPSQAVSDGKAIKVMTGAPIPEGAKGVIKYELVKREGRFIKVYSPVSPGCNIIWTGEDVNSGEIIAKAGDIVTPPLIGLLASFGIDKVPVYCKPKAAIFGTGDELIEVSEPLKPGKIRNSNSQCISAYCRRLGLEPQLLGKASDEIEDIGKLLSYGLEKADIVIATGGVSVGDYDFMNDALKYLGADILFWGLDMKPGAPTLAAVKDDKIIVGLSGNPAAALTAFQILVVPLLKKIKGQNKYHHPIIDVVLKNGFKKSSPIRRFLRGMLAIQNGVAEAWLTGAQGNGILSSMVGCNLLIDVPAGSGPLEEGEKLKAIVIDNIDKFD